MISKIFKTLYIITIVVFVVSFFNLKNLPPKEKMSKEMFNEPIQASTTSISPFTYKYKDTRVNVEPLADYELWGLVVSVNNIGAWYNMYHDKDSVNLKDVCVIWGNNLKSDAYKEVKYKSGEWTCYYSWFGNLSGRFYGNKLSNNHLLAKDKQVIKTINKMHIGDQIRVKGALVDYSENNNGWYRQTSLSRDDTNESSRSGGACEVFFATEAEIIKKASIDWFFLHKNSKLVFLCLILVNILYFYIEARKNSKYLSQS